MGTLYNLYVYKIKGPYPKTRRSLVEMDLDINGDLAQGDIVAMITTLDKLPGPKCEVVELYPHDPQEKRSA